MPLDLQYEAQRLQELCLEHNKISEQLGRERKDFSFGSIEFSVNLEPGSLLEVKPELREPKPDRSKASEKLLDKFLKDLSRADRKLALFFIEHPDRNTRDACYHMDKLIQDAIVNRSEPTGQLRPPESWHESSWAQAYKGKKNGAVKTHISRLRALIKSYRVTSN